MISANEFIAVSPAKAAEMLDISRTYIYKYINAGLLPSFKIGSSRKILVKDLVKLTEYLSEKQL